MLFLFRRRLRNAWRVFLGFAHVEEDWIEVNEARDATEAPANDWLTSQPWRPGIVAPEPSEVPEAPSRGWRPTLV
jgi:hypothetical protein